MRGTRLAGAACAILALAPSGTASAQVDPSGDVRTWTTEHFRVHARAELTDAAVRLAREAERAWTLLAAELVPPGGRVDVTLLDNVDFSNGFATVFPSNRITVFLASPAGDVSLGHFDDWLRLVMTHELVHIFHLDRARGVWSVFRTVFGRAPALFPNAYQPSWVSEGLATYYESKYTRAGRVRGGFHGQLLASRAEGGWPDPNDATFIGPAWPSGFRPYAWGSRFFTHQVALHGDSVTSRYVEETAGQLWPLRISGALVDAGGDPLDDGWRGLREAWRGRGPPTGEILARGLRIEPRPRVAPDGRRVAWVRDDGRDVPHVVVHADAGGVERARYVANGDVELAWVGDTLYGAQLDFGSPVTIWSDLYRWRPDGARERLTHRARLATPFAMPDGRVGVVTTLPGRHALAVWNPATRALDPFASPPGDDWGRMVVSPDGRWVAGARLAEGRWDIVRWPMGRPERVEQVTSDQALDADPAWTPDGRLLFMSERFGLPQIFGWEAGTDRLVRLTDAPAGARQPAMTADGRLLYVTLLADGFAVLALDAPEPVSGVGVAAPAPPFDDAAAVTVTESGYRPWAALRPHYWVPLVDDAGPAGTFVGLTSTGSDPVGRVRWGAALLVAPDAGRGAGALSVRYARWRALSVDVGVQQDWDFAGFVAGETTDEVPASARERFATAGVTWTTRRWRTAAAVRLGMEWEDDRFRVPDGAPDLSSFDLTRWGPVLSAGWSHARRPALAISPEDGVAVSGLYRRRWAVSSSDWSNEWRASASGYLALPLPGFAHWVLAANVRTGLRSGPIRGTFDLGGESGTVFELGPGLNVGSRRAFPLRAYPPGGGPFERIATGTVELRVPLVLVGRGIWKLPFGVDRIALTLFAESGDGWDAGGGLDPFRYPGTGLEGVFDLGLGPDVPLRVRIGAGIPLRTGLGAESGRPRAWVAFGSSF